ncbi:MAG: sporulation protein [Clostridiaceae bacterium]|nr:sporulation protein [Clostridiaceae bacterium]
MKKHANIRGFLIITLLIGLFVLLIIDTEGVLSSGQKAVDLCLKVIIPSLLPFFIISRLILNTGAIHIISRLFEPVIKPLFNLPGAAAFPIIAGWFSGYPAGAKYTADLYKKGLLTTTQAERLLCFCNNSGPLFIVGAVGTGYFNSPGLGIILLVCHMLASFTVGILQRFIFKDNSEESKKAAAEIPVKTEFSSHMLTDAIVDSTGVLLQICGTIIFFAILVQTLETAGVFSGISKLINFATKVNIADYIKILTAGSFEITYGLFLLSSSMIIPVNLKIILTSFLCGFGGLSVFTQVTFFCPKKIKLKKYLYGKLIHGFIASVYTALFLNNHAIPVMNYTEDIYNTEISKGVMLGNVFLLILLIMYLIIVHCCDKKFRRY